MTTEQLMKAIVEAKNKVEAHNVRVTRVVLDPSTASLIAELNGSTLAGMQLITSSDLDPMVLSDDHLGRFARIQF